MRLPSPSELDRAKYCAASCVLPRAGSVGRASERGDAVHEYVLRVRKDMADGHPDAHVVPEEFREFCASIDLDAVPVASEYEVSFAYDTKTGVTRRHDGGERKESEIVGRIDMLDRRDLSGRATIYVGDLKTGLGMTTAPVRENLQLGWGALVAARDARADQALVQIVRVKDTGQIYAEEPVLLGNGALEAVEVEINDVVGRVKSAQAVLDGGGSPKVYTGPHCTYCPAFSSCPEQKALAVQLGSEPGKMITEISEENFAPLYWRWKAAKEVLFRVGNALHGFARQSPQPVGKGMRVGVVRKVRKKIDGTAAHTALIKGFGAVGDKMIEPHVTQASIKRALREGAPPGSVAEKFRQAMKLLDEIGAIERKETETVELYRAEDEGRLIEEKE